jgi:hypothetical protein
MSKPKSKSTVNAAGNYTKPTMRKTLFNKTATAALASVGAGILGTHSAEAAIMAIDVSSINGVNGGVTAGGAAAINDFPTTGGGFLLLFNDYTSGGGRGPSSGLLLTLGGDLGIAAGIPNATPVNFAAGTLIDAAAGGGTFVSGYGQSLFKYMANVSPDFGPNSFLGFKDALGRFGYIETTWNSTRNEFAILSAAYESTPGVGIRTPGAVPEPSTTALLGLGALALGAVRRQRAARRMQEAAAAVSA